MKLCRERHGGSENSAHSPVDGWDVPASWLGKRLDMWVRTR